VLVCLDDEDRSEAGGKEEEEDTGGAHPSHHPLPPTHLKVLPEDVLRMRTWQDIFFPPYLFNFIFMYKNRRSINKDWKDFNNM
jgi:hypothetical protein